MKEYFLLAFFISQLSAMDCLELLTCPDDDGPGSCLMLQNNCEEPFGYSDILCALGVTVTSGCLVFCYKSIFVIKNMPLNIGEGFSQLRAIDREKKGC